MENETSGMEMERALACEILEEFEDFLQRKDARIFNSERDDYQAGEDTEKAILFGADYYGLEDAITCLLKGRLKR